MARTRILQTRWLRGSIIVGIVVASFVSALAIAYELALSRVPRHRAALESLVRGQTGLDIRFNELTLRVGWYGPEAVFRRVELGEPGRSNVLLRAPQLIVGIHAWQTVRTGRLAAGRITLIAPDIDLERLTRSPPSETGTAPAPVAARVRQTQVLDRWKGGVIDLQGGTLRLPDPSGTGSALTLQIRRAALRRAGNEWNGHALVFLPERLGRTARVVAQLTGDINSPASLSGGFRFEGVRLSFASWRSVLGDLPQVARNLPLSGAGDVTVDLTLKGGRVEKADGELHAVDVAVGAPSWLDPVQAPGSALELDYVAGNWRFHRRGSISQLQVEQLVLGREQSESPLPRFTVEASAGHLHSSLKSAPLISVAAIARWLAPELAAGGVVLEGTVEDIDVDWNPARPEGFRLAASARVDDASADSIPHGFTLKRLPVQIHATERRVALEMDAPAAWLRFASDPQQPLDALKLVSRMSITRLGSGWQVNIPQLSYQDASVAGEFSGTVTGDEPEKAPLLDLRGTVEHADVARLQTWFADGVTQIFGSGGMRIGAGQIESGAFELQGRADFAETSRFNGSFNLRNVRIPSEGAWPETRGLNAKVEWTGSRVHASVAEGRAGAFDLESVEAQWDADGARPSRVTGRAHGRLEEALAWIRAHPELQQDAPHFQDIVARGDAVFDFDVTVPAAGSVVPPASARPRARVSTVLENVQFTLAPDLPSVESLRGVLAYDDGHLQRSTLTATWLGGPLTLKIAERRDRKSLSVQAQGFVDAPKLVALSKIRHLAEVSGETSWTGEFVYTPPEGVTPARWQGRADSSLVGIASDLPAPLGKSAGTTLPLHVEITGIGDQSELRANLSDRLRAAFALNVVNREHWSIERGVIRLGGGAVTLPAEDIIQVRGRVRRLDAPAYVLAWQQLRKGSPDSHADIELSADELVIGDHVYDSASVQATAATSDAHPGATALRIEAPALGALTGTLLRGSGDLAFMELQLNKRALTGTGSLRCAADLASCRSEFAFNTTDTAGTLADLGFRADLSAAKGALSGEISWKPRQDRPWLESATGTLSMRFEDGVAHRLDTASADRSFPLFTVPALLGGISRHPSASASAADAPPGVEPEELRFKRLDANFQLRDGQATTSDLHFDGDAEILVRGRIGLIAHDYDHEAWVLRGEERIPASMRRLASAPRVAAAWLTLRDLLGGESASRSRIVLRLRGSWDEPIVSVE